MKVLHVNDVVYAYAWGDPSANGGAERYQWLLARAMAQRGWVVTVGVRKALPKGECLIIDGVKFVGIGDGNILRAWYDLLISEQPDWWFWQCADHWSSWRNTDLAVERSPQSLVCFRRIAWQ